MGTTLQDMVSGKSDEVSKKVAEHAARKAAEAPKKTKAQKGKHKGAKRQPAKKAAKHDGPRKVTIASTMRELIMKGLSNEEVFLGARKALGSDVVTDDKRWFAGWYRADMKRKGQKGVPPSRPSAPKAGGK